ncbi:MAG: PDZ domain-containing protein [Bacteroidetes bacterium]|nr:PDZ domain-containing protein [Bacteroidota bacterium]
MKKLHIIAWSILCSLIIVSLYHFLIPKPERIIVQEKQPDARWVRDYSRTHWDTNTSLSSSNPKRKYKDSTLHNLPGDFVVPAAKGKTAVVYIKTSNSDSKKNWNGEYAHSNGSGVIISPEGYIVTNKHVVDGGENIQVVLDDRRELTAQLLGRDEATDLALLKVDTKNLPHLPIGDSDALSVGEWVLAVGTPFDLQSTVTAGIVSAKARSLEIIDDPTGIESFIQTDAAINPGNSGGALINTKGELVGITTAILTFSGRSEGYSFAIPSNLVKKVMSDLREFGTVHRGIMGVEASTVDFELSRQLGLEEVRGVYIFRVHPQSAANEAGLQSGDVIWAINGKPTYTLADLTEKLGQFRPGDSIEITFIREQKKQIKNIQLRNPLNTTDLVNIRSEGILREIGLEIRNLIRSEKEAIDTEGVKVVSIYRGSLIERTKMDPGFIITHINDQPIHSANDLMSQLEEIQGRIVLQGIYEKYEGPFWYVFNK